MARSGDVTGDGYADVMVNSIDGYSGDIYLYRNDGSGGLGTQLQVLPAATMPMPFPLLTLMVTAILMAWDKSY